VRTVRSRSPMVLEGGLGTLPRSTRRIQAVLGPSVGEETTTSPRRIAPAAATPIGTGLTRR